MLTIAVHRHAPVQRYDTFESEIFDRKAKYKRNAKVFPEDCKRAFELGARMGYGKVLEETKEESWGWGRNEQ